MITIDLPLLAQFLAAEADETRRCPGCGQPFRCSPFETPNATCYPCFLIWDAQDDIEFAALAEADPADAPPDEREPTCDWCGADEPCDDCTRVDWWEGVQLPELYESVHEMALRHSYFA